MRQLLLAASLAAPVALAAPAAQNASSPTDQLLEAAWTGDLAAIRRLLAAGVPVDAERPGNFGSRYPLYQAVYNGQLAAAELLLDNGADPRKQSYGGSEPGQPLPLAVAYGRADMVRLLMRKVTWTKKEIDDAFSYGGYYEASIPALEAMLSLGVSVDATGVYEETALLKAAGHGHVKLLEFLLARKARLDVCSVYGESALGKAATDSSLETVELLLRAGAPADQACGDGATPLANAARVASLPVVKRLLAAGASVDAADGDGYTALMAATGSEQAAPVLEALLDAGADPNRRARDGFTALHLLALSYGRRATPEDAAVLLARGADPDALDEKDGFTALMLAIQEKRPALARFLADKGTVDRRSRAAADASGKATGGITALMAAAAYGDLGTTLELLLAGADPEARDAAGFSAFDYARRTPGVAVGSRQRFSGEVNPSIEAALKLAVRRKAAGAQAAARGRAALERARLDLSASGR